MRLPVVLSLIAATMLPDRALGVAVARKPVLRPAQSPYDPNHRSFLEQAGLMGKRQNTETEARLAQQKCGDGSGAILNPATLVSEAVAIGLPHASNTGVVFMRVTVSEADGCGAYSCFVSPDATGTSWTSMPILTDVPTVQAGCGLEAEPSDYSLVAQIPRDTVCTGEGGACLVMCKNERTELGNCAAIAFSPAGAGERAPSASTSSASPPMQGSALPASASSATSLVSTATTVISSFGATSVITSTRIVSATQTTVVRPSASLARVTPSTPAASAPASGAFASSASSGKAIATIVAFSGENGPGGLAEQQKIGTHAFAVAGGEQEDEQTSGVARAVQPVAAPVAAVILAAIYAACFA